jgi:beta-fructofuranosidase
MSYVQGRPELFTRYADRAPVGDVMPFYDNGVYHLFCLTPPVGSLFFPERLRTSWRHLRSSDLVHWEELPDALAPGADGELDRDGVWTGSVVRTQDGYHSFYTGHTLEGDTPQSVCHATSEDCITWSKDPLNPLSVPDPDLFEGKDWRDPFVFWNDGERCYWMLVSSRSLTLPAASRGVIALQTSVDLKTWTPATVLYETFLTHCPECPEIFRLGEKWVMGYSRFTDRRGTVYRFADDPRGPWHSFDAEGIDGANWYAAKSLTSGDERRLAFGWLPERNPVPSADTGNWLWAGDLAVPRELGLVDDDQLGVRLPVDVDACVQDRVAYVAGGRAGQWAGEDGDGFAVEADGRFGFCVLRPTETAEDYIVSAAVSGAKDAAIVGLAVQTNDQLDRGLAVLWYPSEHAVRSIDLAAVRSEIANEYEKATTEYAPVAERYVSLSTSETVTLRVVVRGDLVEAFVADMTCLSYRLPSSEPGAVALLVQDGSARFSGLSWRHLSHAQ